MYTCIYKYTYLNICKCIYLCMYIFILMYLFTCVYIHINVFIYVCIYSYKCLYFKCEKSHLNFYGEKCCLNICCYIFKI